MLGSSAFEYGSNFDLAGANLQAFELGANWTVLLANVELNRFYGNKTEAGTGHPIISVIFRISSELYNRPLY